MNKGSVWYHPETDLIALQVTYEPIINEFELAEPTITLAGIYRQYMWVHDPALLKWIWLGQLEPEPPPGKEGE